MSSLEIKQASIVEIRIDNSAGLFVLPPVTKCGSFDFIWRDASGIRWNSEHSALVAAEPNRWDLFKLYCQILAAVKSEYGWHLSVDSETRWQNIPIELRQRIESCAKPPTQDSGSPA